MTRAAGNKHLVFTHFRTSRFADPKELVAEAASAFGSPVEVAHDFDVFDF